MIWESNQGLLDPDASSLPTVPQSSDKYLNFLWKKKFDSNELSKFIWNEESRQSLSSLADSFEPDNILPVLEKFQVKGPYISFVPSASHETKRWPIERYVDLAKRLSKDMTVVILAGPDDRFCEAFNGLDNIINLQGKTSFLESSRIAGGSKLCIGNDTGLVHIAEAQNVSSFMIMGPTSEVLGFYPHLESSHAFSKKMWCRPCSATGSKKCFRKQRYCLIGIEVDEVYELTAQRLGL